jgi:predicted PurR-regulated permease PerM
MITGTLGVLWVLFLVIVLLCAAELLLRGFDRLLKRKWKRLRDRRILKQIGQQPLSMFHKPQAD